MDLEHSIFGTSSSSNSNKSSSSNKSSIDLNEYFNSSTASTKEGPNKKEGQEQSIKEQSIKEVLNEYFKLKLTYETQQMINKKKIMGYSTLSNKEKRIEYLKLKPKCINCKRPGGTIFKVIYHAANDTDDSYRQYSATCGIIADPCNLMLKIDVGKVELLPDILNTMQQDIKDYKNKIIDDKNKLLFGYLTTEEALQNFEKIKEDISFYTSLYEFYLRYYNDIVNNDEKTKELTNSITNSYIHVEQIKECMSKMNETNNTQYAHDAVSIYIQTLLPLLEKIRHLKYNESFVWNNDVTQSCDLIQRQYSIQNMSYSSFTDRIVSYSVGLEIKKKNKNQPTNNNDNIIIESSSTNNNDKEIRDKIWMAMPVKLKTNLQDNPQWMNDFMNSCVNLRTSGKPCELIAPRELIVPPTLLSNGKYDFGIKIYNDIFNKLDKSTQKTYLTLFVETNGIKNYKTLIETMNRLIETEVGFERGFF